MIRETLTQKSGHPSTDLHLFADTLRDGHGSDTTRLSTTYDPMFTVTVLVEKLSQLCRLSRSGLPNHDNDWMVKT